MSSPSVATPLVTAEVETEAQAGERTWASSLRWWTLVSPLLLGPSPEVLQLD